MDTIARVMELADERNLSLFKLSQLCDVSYSTLKNAEMRGSQLGVPTIERICVALGVTLSDFLQSQIVHIQNERPRGPSDKCPMGLLAFADRGVLTGLKSTGLGYKFKIEASFCSEE